jgi:hypothetical protein
MRIVGYMFGKRTVYTSLEEAWICGSQLVCISRDDEELRYVDIRSDDDLEQWVNNGIDAGMFQVLDV